MSGLHLALIELTELLAEDNAELALLEVSVVQTN